MQDQPAVVIYIVYLVGAVYSLFLIGRMVTSAKRERKAKKLSGLSASTYFPLCLLIWIAERNLLRHAGYLGETSTQSRWAPLTLWWPPSLLSHSSSLAVAHRPEWALEIVVPVLFFVIALSVLRLTNACLPLWLGLFVVIPFVNFALLLFLSVTPSQSCENRSSDWRDYVLPRNQLGSAVVSCVVTAAVGIAFSQFGTWVLGTYGWALFTLVPVIMGFIAACIYGFSEPRSSTSCISVALASVIVGGLAILGFAIEGAICVLLAAPLALPLAAFGGWLGYLAQRNPDVNVQNPQIAGALLLLLPFTMYGEHRIRAEARQIAVSTSIVIHAPADRVWTSVIRLSSVPKPESIIFHSVAYPIKTTLEGTGIGARRECVFSTGSIVEPIEVWSPGKELRFAVVSQPPLMRELTPYPDVHPPHLRLEYLRSREGQFTLSPQPDGSTLLTGTSYYESRLWPGAYWQIWTDAIAHTVHRVVLQEIKRQAEE